MSKDKLPICKDKRTCGMSATIDGIKKMHLSSHSVSGWKVPVLQTR